MMALNANILLQGQQADVVGSLARGAQAGQQINDFSQANALRDVYRQHGAGIMRGEEPALNALAQFSPQEALGVQGARQGLEAGTLDMQATQQRMDMLTREEQRALDAQAAQMTAAERAAEAAQIEQAVAMALQAQTPEQWDAVVGQYDPSLVGQFENREMIAGRFMSVADSLKRMDAMGAGPEYQMLSPDEITQMGLEPGAYQRDAAGKITRVGGGGVTVNNMPGQDKFDEAFASGDAAMMSTVSEAGLSAQRNLARIDELAGLLTESPSGFAAAAALRAGELGINTEGLDTLQAAQALINSLVPEQRQPGSGPMSDADLALFKQSLPRLINQPGGNRQIIETMRGIAEYDAQGAAIVQRLRAGEIDRATAFSELQNRANPLERFRSQGGASAEGGASASTPDAPDGVDPALLEFMTPEERALFQ
jgi:hypothetical protein